MSSAQLRPLMALRWRMVRTTRARWGFAALASCIPLLCLVAVGVGQLAPDERRSDVALLAATAYLSVAVLAVLAPLVAGGGNELFPEEQLVGFPVTARTQYAASLALTPLNLAWTTQLVALLGVTAFIAPRTDRVVLALGTCVAYVVFVTVAGQALGWLVVGARHHTGGRRAAWAIMVVLAGSSLFVVATGNLGNVLDRSPTRYVIIGALGGPLGLWGTWSLTTGGLVVLTTAAYFAGLRTCTWALRQPGSATHRISSTVVRRRRQGRNARAELLATDRASVWRSPSLRRGLVVLAVLPGLVAATAGLAWPSLVLLPGLVAAGAGLLFGVNAFCLDGPGSVWLASLPHRPGAAFWCKAQVVAEVCLLAIAITLTAGSLRADRLPTSGEAAAVLCCAIAALLWVVATCMELSVSRPHRADLRGPRDTPAPPGVMAAYSARLAVSTTLLAVIFSGLAEVASWTWSVAVALPFCLLSVRRLIRAARRWEDPSVRSRVVTTVAAG